VYVFSFLLFAFACWLNLAFGCQRLINVVCISSPPFHPLFTRFVPRSALPFCSSSLSSFPPFPISSFPSSFLRLPFSTLLLSFSLFFFFFAALFRLTFPFISHFLPFLPPSYSLCPVPSRFLPISFAGRGGINMACCRFCYGSAALKHSSSVIGTLLTLPA